MSKAVWRLSAEELLLSNYGAGEDSWESAEQQGDQTNQSLRISTLNIHWKDWCWNWSSNTLTTWCEEDLLTGKDPDPGKDWGQEKGATEDEMDGWHHWFNGHEFEQVPGVGDRQGSLVCCNTWGHKESDTTEQLNWTEVAASKVLPRWSSGKKFACQCRRCRFNPWVRKIPWNRI